MEQPGAIALRPQMLDLHGGELADAQPGIVAERQQRRVADALNIGAAGLEQCRKREAADDAELAAERSGAAWHCAAPWRRRCARSCRFSLFAG